MNNSQLGKPSLYENPFELGTNEYSQQTNLPNLGQNSNNFIAPVADFSYAENSFASNLFLQQSNQEGQMVYKDPLAFSADGKSFLTFKNPPEWFVKEQSLKAIEVKDGEVVTPQTNEVQFQFNDIPKPEAPTLQEKYKEEPKEKKPGINPLKMVNPVFKVITKVSEWVATFFGFFTETFLGIGGENKKPLTEAEKKQQEKELKQAENKRKFWQDLAVLSAPAPIAGAVRDEMLVTNQLNGFYEEYKGVLKRDGRVNEYHRSNRIKKEIENNAAQIAQSRANKIANSSNKVGKFSMQAGEMLMGAENPSHFTKTLG